MPIPWDHPAAIELRKQIVQSILDSDNPYKGNTMNDITSAPVTEVQPVPFDVDMVDVLDANGNPTGERRPREAAPTEATGEENK